MFKLLCERYFLLRNIFRHFLVIKQEKRKECIAKLNSNFISTDILSVFF